MKIVHRTPFYLPSQTLVLRNDLRDLLRHFECTYIVKIHYKGFQNSVFFAGGSVCSWDLIKMGKLNGIDVVFKVTKTTSLDGKRQMTKGRLRYGIAT